jgi:hypothetical protein
MPNTPGRSAHTAGAVGGTMKELPSKSCDIAPSGAALELCSFDRAYETQHVLWNAGMQARHWRTVRQPANASRGRRFGTSE